MTKFGHKFICSLRLQLLLKKINISTYFENIIVGLYVFYALNTNMPYFMPIRCYLPYVHKKRIILNYKNLQFKQLIDNIVINL